MNKKSCIFIAWITLACFQAKSAVAVDFDASGDWTASDWQDPFTFNFTQADSNFDINTAGDGVGAASGRLDAVSNHSSRVLNLNGVSEDNSGSYTASVFVLTGGVSSGDIANAGVGIGRSTGSTASTLNESGGLINSGFSGDGLFAGFRTDADFTTGTQFGVFGGTSTLGTDDFTLASNNWYEISLTVTLSDATTGTYSAFVADRGADGITAGSTVASLSGAFTLTNGGFSGSSLFGSIGAGNNSGDNIVAVDNFSIAVIPEPGTLALVGLSIAALAIMRKRR